MSETGPKISPEEQIGREAPAGMEQFDPETSLLGVLWGADRKPLMESYQARASFQKEGIASMVQGLEGAIRENPDISLAQLSALTLDYQRICNLTRHQQTVLRIGLEQYIKKHQQVSRMRSLYPQDEALFAHLFGKNPVGKIEVLQGPMTLYFRCFDPCDYGVVYQQSSPDQEENETMITQGIGHTTGVFLSSGSTPELLELEGCVAAENVTNTEEDQDPEKTFVHEEQHAVMKLLTDSLKQYRGRLDSYKIIVPSIIKERALKHPRRTRKRELKNFLRNIRRIKEESAASEILAYFKEGRTIDGIFQELTLPESRGGTYDYFPRSGRRKLEHNLQGQMGKENKSLIHQAVREVFVTEYQFLLRRSLDTILNLQQQGMSKERIITLLMTERLRLWKRVSEMVKKGSQNRMATPSKDYIEGEFVEVES